jgi:hypothetical protein
MGFMTGNGKMPPTPSAPSFGLLCNWIPSPKHSAVPSILHPLSGLPPRPADDGDFRQGLNHENYETNPNVNFDFTNKSGPMPCVWTPAGWKNEPKWFGVPPSGGLT